MIREGFFSRCPTIRVSLAEYERIPIGQPEFLSEAEIGHRWKEIWVIRHSGLLAEKRA